MYLCNGEKRVHLRESEGWDLHETLLDPSVERGEYLVEIGSYVLMPNHLHLILREIRDGGIPLFMQKLFTGYTMYFNKKYNRTGALFSGTFKSRHISDDRYLKRVVPYIFLNPLELFEPRWKQGVGNLTQLERRLISYPYSSMPDFLRKERPEKNIISRSIETMFDKKPSIAEMLTEAQAYYREENQFA